MLPARLSIVTYNIWNTERWEARAPALERFLTLFAPDILCLQELRKTTRDFIDRALSRHHRVEGALPGWASESNIYWNGDALEEAGHGAEPVGHVEPERRLFWARLRLKSSGRTIFVATVHLTPPSGSDENETGVSPRVPQLKRIAAELTRLVKDGEPAFIMGDMNDAWHPQRILLQAGYVNCFAALGMQSPPTYQCYPTTNVAPGARTLTQAIDLIAANRHARPIAASVPQCYAGDVAPSDHWPVQAVYQLD